MIIKTRGEIYEEVLAEFRSGNYKNTDLKSEWFRKDEIVFKDISDALYMLKRGLSPTYDFKIRLEELEKMFIVPLSPEKKRVICFDGYPMIDRDTSREKEIMLGMPKKKRCGVCRK
jgi:hypothetical protein